MFYPFQLYLLALISLFVCFSAISFLQTGTENLPALVKAQLLQKGRTPETSAHAVPLSEGRTGPVLSVIHSPCGVNESAQQQGEGGCTAKLHSQAASSPCWCHSLSQLIHPHNQPARYMHKMKDGYESLYFRNKLASYMQNTTFANYWKSRSLLQSSQELCIQLHLFIFKRHQNCNSFLIEFIQIEFHLQSILINFFPLWNQHHSMFTLQSNSQNYCCDLAKSHLHRSASKQWMLSSCC